MHLNRVASRLVLSAANDNSVKCPAHNLEENKGAVNQAQSVRANTVWGRGLIRQVHERMHNPF